MDEPVRSHVEAVARLPADNDAATVRQSREQGERALPSGGGIGRLEGKEKIPACRRVCSTGTSPTILAPSAGSDAPAETASDCNTPTSSAVTVGGKGTGVPVWSSIG